jgi:hypothetical protein
MRALTMLNQHGDVTVVWEPEQDEQMRAIIQKKMDEGCSFYIIEPRLGGLQPPTKSRLNNFDAALKQRALAISDADLLEFVGMGSGEVIKTPKTKAKTVRRAKKAAEVASSESIGVKPRVGG